jgi:lipopolysaccharide/colanic/teichoic acid biosynthesis glycosyltransferase
VVHPSIHSKSSKNGSRAWLAGDRIRMRASPPQSMRASHEMSWIGPRPISVDIAEALEAAIPQYVNRQLVLPGLTGWAQVSHGYASNHVQEVEKLSFDLYYLKHMSFDLDLLIIFETIRTLILRRGRNS